MELQQIDTKKRVSLKFTKEELEQEIAKFKRAVELNKEYTETGDISKLIEASSYLRKTIRVEDKVFTCCSLDNISEDIVTYNFEDCYKVITNRKLKKHNPEMAYINKYLGLATGDTFESKVDNCVYQVMDQNNKEIFVKEKTK